MSDNPIRACPSCASNEYRRKYDQLPHLIVQCRRCGLVFHGNPPPEEEIYEEYYGGPESAGDEYRPDSQTDRLAELHAINQQRVALLRKYKLSARVLDIGCGRGYFLKTARERSYEATGIDVSGRAVEYARREFSLNVRRATVESVGVSHERFDIITMWHVLEHLNAPLQALRTVRNLLAESGFCLVEVPNLHSMKFILSGSRWEGGNHPRYHRTFFTAAALRRMLLEAGYARVRRLKVSYAVPGRGIIYRSAKVMFNHVGMDAFLDFIAWK